MPTVKVLIDGVGNWAKGDIVKDAPPGLVQIAKNGTKNAATGEIVAEILDDSDEFKYLQARAKELKIAKYTKMNADELKEAILQSIKSTVNNGEEIGDSLKSISDIIGGDSNAGENPDGN